jgi:hypothetical protein
VGASALWHQVKLAKSVISLAVNGVWRVIAPPEAARQQLGTPRAANRYRN